MTDKCHKQGCTSRSLKLKKCGTCGYLFHNSCGEFASYRDKSNADAKVHLCSTCNGNPANSASLLLLYSSRSNSVSSQSSAKRKKADQDQSDSSDEEEPDLKAIMKELRAGNKHTEKLVTSLRNDVHTFNSNLGARCDVIDQKVTELESKISDLQTAHTQEMDKLRDKCDELDFKTKTEVYIHGYANAGMADLDIKSAVIHLAEHLDLTITERDILRTRVVRRRKDAATPSYAAVARPPIISAEFFSHEMALRLVNARKSYGKLTNRDLLGIDNVNSIAVSFPLSREKYELLLTAKSRAAVHNFRFVWNSNGSVFIRQAEGTRAIKVRNAAHLDVLLPPGSQSPPPTQPSTATLASSPMDTTSTT